MDQLSRVWFLEEAENFIFNTASALILGLAQPHIQWVTGVNQSVKVESAPFCAMWNKEEWNGLRRLSCGRDGKEMQDKGRKEITVMYEEDTGKEEGRWGIKTWKNCFTLNLNWLFTVVNINKFPATLVRMSVCLWVVFHIENFWTD